METKKILLADPSESVRKIIVNAFREEDLQLLTADDFDSAVELISDELPSLILAGTSLPGKDGYALCEYVKGLHPLLPVVMLVGTDETLNSDEALRVGADDYFIRPFKSQNFIEKISDLLDSSERNAGDVFGGISAPAEPTLVSPAVSDVADSALIDIGESDTKEEGADAAYGEIPSVAESVEAPSPQVPEVTEEPEENREVDVLADGLDSTEITESSEDFLAEMGIKEDEELDVVFGNIDAQEAYESTTSDKDEDEEEGDILEEFLADIDDVEAETGDILADGLGVEPEMEDVVIGGIERDENVTEEVEEEIVQIDEPAREEVAPDEISFNDDAVIEELNTDNERPGVAASVEKKGVAVEGIVEISKSKIEELIINNTREDVKSIAYELVPGLVKDPVSKIVPEAVKRASEKLVAEVASQITANVAEGIIKDIAADITTQKAIEHIAEIASAAVIKAAEARIKEIATDAAREAANEIISALAEKTTIDVAERLITGEIKSFKSKLSKEG